MSSFIPSAKHFNSIEKSIGYLAWNNDFYFDPKTHDLFPYTFLYGRCKNPAKFTEEELPKMMDTLRELTAVCVCLQYKSHYEGKLDAEIEEQKEMLLAEKHGGDSLTLVQLYKAISCLMYQIETNHLKELRELSQDEQNALSFMKQTETALAHFIVAKSTEYDKAKWAIS